MGKEKTTTNKEKKDVLPSTTKVGENSTLAAEKQTVVANAPDHGEMLIEAGNDAVQDDGYGFVDDLLDLDLDADDFGYAASPRSNVVGEKTAPEKEKNLNEKGKGKDKSDVAISAEKKKVVEKEKGLKEKTAKTVVKTVKKVKKPSTT